MPELKPKTDLTLLTRSVFSTISQPNELSNSNSQCFLCRGFELFQLHKNSLKVITVWLLFYLASSLTATHKTIKYRVNAHCVKELVLCYVFTVFPAVGSLVCYVCLPLCLYVPCVRYSMCWDLWELFPVFGTCQVKVQQTSIKRKLKNINHRKDIFSTFTLTFNPPHGQFSCLWTVKEKTEASRGREFSSKSCR